MSFCFFRLPHICITRCQCELEWHFNQNVCIEVLYSDTKSKYIMFLPRETVSVLAKQYCPVIHHCISCIFLCDSLHWALLRIWHYYTMSPSWKLQNLSWQPLCGGNMMWVSPIGIPPCQDGEAAISSCFSSEVQEPEHHVTFCAVPTSRTGRCH
jgi:hypothetical protein